MQKRKVMIATLAALTVSISTTFGVMALSAELPIKEDTQAIVQTATTEKVQETVAEAAPAIERIVGLSLGETKISGNEGEKVTLKVDANTNKKIKFTSSDKKVATVSSKGVVSFKSKGKAKISAKVEGEEAVCNVNVKEFIGNNISDGTMSKIAAEIGRQTDYAYSESTIMCSAYSFAYAYYQVTGTAITPGSVWTYGGCNWAGGSYLHCSSAEDMLATIKAQLDKNRACVGLLSTGSAYTHYVTFYGYTGSGTTLSDYKVLDPWDGNLTTGSGYSYSGDGYDVVTIG
ncbi:MAG: Ig-like domain-containing protein [Ruminococcus sp.]|nr:Ig-like domain-containing protein [Ruminococcus sp.]